MIENRLQNISNIPVTTNIISSLYPDIVAKNNKIASLERNKEIIRLKKGLFVASPEITGKKLSIGLIANHIYAPSYISMHSALRHYGLIPEAVHLIQSMTLKHSREFSNELGNFSYTRISQEAFPIGLTMCKEGEISYLIATPEKALCDLIANSPAVNLRYVSEARIFLEDDIRLDMDEFYNMNTDIFREYIEVGKKNTSISTVIKLLENE